MTTSPKPSDEPTRSNVRWPNVEEALKLIEHWLTTDDHSEDTTEWETLKELLDKDRLSDRKFFPK